MDIIMFTQFPKYIAKVHIVVIIMYGRFFLLKKTTTIKQPRQEAEMFCCSLTDREENYVV